MSINAEEFEDRHLMDIMEASRGKAKLAGASNVKEKRKQSLSKPVMQRKSSGFDSQPQSKVLMVEELQKEAKENGGHFESSSKKYRTTITKVCKSMRGATGSSLTMGVEDHNTQLVSYLENR